jgi:hypothetical protein
VFFDEPICELAVVLFFLGLEQNEMLLDYVLDLVEFFHEFLHFVILGLLDDLILMNIQVHI